MDIEEAKKELEKFNNSIGAILQGNKLIEQKVDRMWRNRILSKIQDLWNKCPKNSINEFATTERNNKIDVLTELLKEELG